MKTLIDGVEVTIQWEKEKNLGEVRQSLAAWLEDQGFQLSSLLINGRSTDDDGFPLGQMELLEAETVTNQNKPLQNLVLLRDFFHLVSEALRHKNLAVIQDLQNEYRILSSHLFPLLNPIRQRIEADLLPFETWNDHQEMATSALRLSTTLETWLAAYENPQGCLEDCLGRLGKLLPELRSIAVLFQKGQDHQAFELFLQSLELLDELNRLAPLLPEGWEALFHQEFQWKTLNTEIRSFLTEIEGAMGMKDYVFLSDLLEYEICPRLEILLDREVRLP